MCMYIMIQFLATQCKNSHTHTHPYINVILTNDLFNYLPSFRKCPAKYTSQFEEAMSNVSPPTHFSVAHKHSHPNLKGKNLQKQHNKCQSRLNPNTTQKAHMIKIKQHARRWRTKHTTKSIPNQFNWLRQQRFKHIHTFQTLTQREPNKRNG